jgi:DNA-3-methyladenine glycosylase II
MTYQTLEIPITGTFSKTECLWFLSRGFDDCIYKVFSDKIRRAFISAGELMLVDIYPSADKLTVEWLTDRPSKTGISYVETFLTGWFDLDSKLEDFYDKLSVHPDLAYMPVRYKGLRFMGMPDLFEALAWCIIGQQINLTFAYKIKRRLVERFGESIVYEGDHYYLFPTAERIAGINTIEFREMQFSEKKAEYLITIAGAITAGKLSKDILHNLPDFNHRLKHLTSFRGIGAWTANYVLMKSFKEPSGIPYGDAGLLNALLNHKIINDKSDTGAIKEFFSAFSGWESYLVFYLWRSLAPMENELI